MQNLWVHQGRIGSVALMLTGVALFSVVHAGPPSARPSAPQVTAPTPSSAAVEAASGAPSLIDPMERVREKLNSQLNSQLKVPVSLDQPSAETQSEDPESLAMERLRARLAKRLGLEAQVTSSNELRLTTRIASPSEVEAARLAANAPAQRRDPGRSAKPRGGRDQIVTIPVAVAEAPPQLGQPWAYEGPNGPKAWPRLKPEYAACGSGQRQSPIDIRDGIRLNLEPVIFEYSATPAKVLDDGRSLLVQPGPGNTLVLRGQRYELRQVRFHTPAEDQVQGKVHDMSVSLVHEDKERGRWLVLSLMVDRGLNQPVLQKVLDNLPLEKGDDVQISDPLDWRGLLPVDRSYFIYMGSLSTPPCTEGVVRIVMKTPMMLSPEQLAIFTRLYPTTARPVQLSMGRVVKESN